MSDEYESVQILSSMFSQNGLVLNHSNKNINRNELLRTKQSSIIHLIKAVMKIFIRKRKERRKERNWVSFESLIAECLQVASMCLKNIIICSENDFS